MTITQIVIALYLMLLFHVPFERAYNVAYFLKQFSQQITSLTIKGDTLSRIGGDEFTIITSTLKSPLTENLLMENNDIVNDGLKNISALGSIISLNDFGMGYSSLSRLQALPINTLKIDKLFVANIQSKSDKIIVIDTIIKLGHELGMGVIAEGIETEAQLNYLVSRNCFLGQGFLFSKPLQANVFEKIAYL
jgi:EAL domain-containing protein (putative c-di-GMP-specific phosphodiesterase class I)